MPITDNKVAELAKLKNKLVEIEARLKEENKITARLKAHNEKKMHQITRVETELAAEQERFRWKREELNFNIMSIENEANAKMQKMKTEEKDLLEELAEFEVTQFENERLHLKLKQISSEQINQASQQLEEREKRKQKDFDTRMAMEEILRKIVKNVDESYQQEAISKMQYEASQANIENESIHREFDLRESKTEHLIKEQQKSYENLMKIKIARDVLGISTEILEKNIKVLNEQNDRNQNDLLVSSRNIESLREEVQVLKLAVNNKKSLQNIIGEVKNKVFYKQLESLKYKKMALRLCHKIVDESLSITEKARMEHSAMLSQQLDSLSIDI